LLATKTKKKFPISQKFSDRRAPGAAHSDRRSVAITAPVICAMTYVLQMTKLQAQLIARMLAGSGYWRRVPCWNIGSKTSNEILQLATAMLLK